MRLSREKLNKLASASTEQLASLKKVEFLEGYDDIRQEMRRLLEELLVQRRKARQSGPPEDRKPAPHHSRRHARVEYPLPQVLQRGSQEASRLLIQINVCEKGAILAPFFSPYRTGAQFQIRL